MSIIRVFSPLPESEKMFEIKASHCSVLQFQNKFTGSSIITLAVSPDSDASHFLQKKCWIVTEDDEPFIIEHREQTNTEVCVVAYSPHFGFDGRWTIPAEGQYAIESTGSADKVVKDFIRGSTPVGARSLSITCAADQAGTPISDQSRNKKLGEEVIRVLTGSGRGERFEWGMGGITFDTYAGVDRSVSNTEGNPVCIFAGRLKNLEDYTYTEDCTTEVTTPYVAGQGQGEEREIYVMGNDAAGWGRRETFIDARDITIGDTDKLLERGTQAIVAAGMQIVAEARDNVNLIYGVDYSLGDIVTVQVKVKGYQKMGNYYEKTEQTLSFDLRITQVAITYDQGARSIDLTFGEVVRSKTTQLENKIAQLEATEAPAAAAIDLSNVQPSTLMQIIADRIVPGAVWAKKYGPHHAFFRDSSTADEGILGVGPDDATEFAQYLRFGARLRHNDGSGEKDVWHAGNLDVDSGTWTPVFYGATTAGSPTYNSRTGLYYKIGNLVIAWFWVNVSNKGGAVGYIQVSGLPYTPLNYTANQGYMAQPVYNHGGISLANATGISAFVPPNVTYISFKLTTVSSGAFGTTTLQDTHISAGCSLGGMVIYRIA